MFFTIEWNKSSVDWKGLGLSDKSELVTNDYKAAMNRSWIDNQLLQEIKFSNSQVILGDLSSHL